MYSNLSARFRLIHNISGSGRTLGDVSALLAHRTAAQFAEQHLGTAAGSQAQPPAVVRTAADLAIRVAVAVVETIAVFLVAFDGVGEASRRGRLLVGLCLLFTRTSPSFDR